MIDILIQRLSNSCAALKSVNGAVDLAGLMEQQFAVPFDKRPAAWVMFGGDNPERNEMGSDEVVQKVTELATITICLGDGSTGARQAAKDAIMTARDAVLACLLGFVPEAERGALQYRGTQMLAMRPRTIWFQMGFSRAYGVHG